MDALLSSIILTVVVAMMLGIIDVPTRRRQEDAESQDLTTRAKRVATRTLRVVSKAGRIPQKGEDSC